MVRWNCSAAMPKKRPTALSERRRRIAKASMKTIRPPEHQRGHVGPDELDHCQRLLASELADIGGGEREDALEDFGDGLQGEHPQSRPGSKHLRGPEATGAPALAEPSPVTSEPQAQLQVNQISRTQSGSGKTRPPRRSIQVSGRAQRSKPVEEIDADMGVDLERPRTAQHHQPGEHVPGGVAEDVGVAGVEAVEPGEDAPVGRRFEPDGERRCCNG